MTERLIRIGSAENVIAYDDADYISAVETDQPIKAGAPVDDNDVLRLGDVLPEIIDVIYPVGSLYISTLSTNPATILGIGTWGAFGVGRVLVGIDPTDTDFDTVEETGGAKTVTLDTTMIPAHHHAILRERSATTGSDTTSIARSNDASSTIDDTVNTEDTGGGLSHNNVQPYIVVYIWKRTA